MTFIGSATQAMFHRIASETYDRVFDWFKEHPDAMFAYWAKDEFLSDKATDSERKAFIERHKEIDDIKDHTKVLILNDAVVLCTFCPRLKAGVREMYEAGITHEAIDNVEYYIEQDDNNYRIMCFKKK